ncbi:type 1 glutamine amidotransferase domain-containing protein [Paraferrimonas haliotis]|uniref:DJ-1/PfpI domain-containing protein n=1 Tax=Paraferrimonas haliotis TaxID=2013866 RepID=A0AA37TVU6_9GAMM|nr:type 1 glutamine amidotransferase domain-containing protein [Paraferrimonas haliotis]GLS83695.1 hypothetical protein GCM10007894_16720 [Paraferrimonas haliotis]
MKRLLSLLFFCVLTASGATHASNTETKKVAMLISGHGKIDPALSYDLEELVQSYLVFHKNGVEIDIVSPQGGAVLVKNNKDDLAYIKLFKQQTKGMKQLANTLSSVQASQNTYDAVFVVGGDGAVFDLPFEKHTQRWLTSFAQADRPIAAVCHGPAALLDIKLGDGSFYVAGKRVNSFTSVEDYAFKKENVEKYPIIIQTELEKRGAHFVANSPMLPFVTRDGNLITAQNPMSVAKAAEALLIQIGVTPAERALFKDEATMELISKARYMGVSYIDLAMVKNPERYNKMYLALYGIYAYKLANTEEDKARELRLMEKIGEHFKHPKYSLHLISTYLDRGENSMAEFHYQAAKKQFSDFKLPEALEAKWTGE